MSDPTLHWFVQGVATAYYTCAWADNAENNGPPYPAGCELTHQAGEPPPDWRDWAMRVTGAIEHHSKLSVHTIVQRALDTNDSPCNPNAFIKDLGFCLAMQAAGSGVRCHPDIAVDVPHIPGPEANWDADGKYVDGSLYGSP